MRKRSPAACRGSGKSVLLGAESCEAEVQHEVTLGLVRDLRTTDSSVPSSLNKSSLQHLKD